MHAQVPALVHRETGEIVVQSEVVSELIDSVGVTGVSLKPADPILLAKVRAWVRVCYRATRVRLGCAQMRSSMKLFDAVLGPLYDLLGCQDPAQDSQLIDALQARTHTRARAESERRERARGRLRERERERQRQRERETETETETETDRERERDRDRGCVCVCVCV
jgi:hypothetical protein